MAWVVDSCIVLDVALRDEEFGLPAALLQGERLGVPGPGL